jgi:hypothetical protein
MCCNSSRSKTSIGRERTRSRLALGNAPFHLNIGLKGLMLVNSEEQLSLTPSKNSPLFEDGSYCAKCEYYDFRTKTASCQNQALKTDLAVSFIFGKIKSVIGLKRGVSSYSGLSSQFSAKYTLRKTGGW